MEAADKVRIVLADDHEVYLDGLLATFAGQPRYEIVDVCRNGEQLLRSVKIHEPDLVLIDLKMPVMSGIDAIAALKESHSKIYCLVLTNFDNDHLIMDALEAGAFGYINKAAPKADLFTAIDTCMRNYPYYCKSTSTRLVKMIAGSRFNPNKAERPDTFSEIELKIIAGHCEDKTVAEIAAEVFLSKRTIEKHKESIMRKMDVRTTNGMVAYAIRRGLYSPDEL
jgi:DNA-binding NarL/FixJ family response regulator